MRILLVFIALAIIVMVAKRLWLRPRPGKPERRQLSGQMVQCRHCGMYVPEAEAIRSQDQWYCSREHSIADRRGETEDRQ